MKKNGFLAIIAMAALSFAACNKEGLPQNDATDLPSDEPVVETPVVLEPGVYPATVVAEPIMPDLAGTKAVFDNGTFAWEAGDAIACFQHFDVLNNAETNVITTMTTAAGDENFAGSLPYTESEPYTMNFIHPASVAIRLVGVGQDQKEQLEINLPNKQDGRLGNLGNYFIAGAAKVSCVVSPDESDNISITTENVKLNKYPVFAVKVDVPEAYNAQSIKIEALRNGTALGLAGKSYLNVNNCQHKGPYSYPSDEYLTIRHNDDSQISGDTYGVMMPYGKDKPDPCTVDKIKFTVTTSSSQTYTFAKSVSALKRGTIYDLGTFPTSCVTPKFSFDENGAVVMTSSPAEANIYYTTDGTEPSAEATLYEGPVKITADTPFKAVAICEGLGNSAVAEYTVSLNVSAPEIIVTSTGEISVNPVSGLTYKYTMTTDGSIPGEPETELDVETGINILNTGTGTYKIRISATNAFSNTAETKAQYRIYYQKDEITTAPVSIEPSGTNTTAFAPFVVNNYHTSATLNLTNSSSYYWTFGKTNGVNSQQNVYIGVYTEYQSNMSFHTYLNANKKTYTRYGGEKVAGPNGMINYAADNAHAAKTWNSWWTAGPVETGKLVEFTAANGSLVRGWAVLEQGFESFNPAAASVSNEAPVPGQNVAY